MKSEYRSAKKRRIAAERDERKNAEKISDDDNFSDDDEPIIKPPKFYEIKEGEEFVGLNSNRLESINNSR